MNRKFQYEHMVYFTLQTKKIKFCLLKKPGNSEQPSNHEHL